MGLIDDAEELVTNNYVVVETFALVQARLGLAAAAALDADILPLIRVQWIDGELHRAAVGAVLAAGRRRLGLVDCASFEVMHRLGIRRAFAFDRHSVERGFEVIPPP